MAPKPPLTPDKELEVAESMGRGVSRKELAYAYGIAQSTLTAIKQRLPLFAWKGNKSPQDEFNF